MEFSLFVQIFFFFSPVKDTVIVNDRWGKEAECHHGDVFTCYDQYNPGTAPVTHSLIYNLN